MQQQVDRGVRPPFDKNKVKCHTCKDMGHFANECPQLAKEKEEQQAMMKAMREQMRQTAEAVTAMAMGRQGAAPPPVYAPALAPVHMASSSMAPPPVPVRAPIFARATSAVPTSTPSELESSVEHLQSSMVQLEDVVNEQTEVIKELLDIKDKQAGFISTLKKNSTEFRSAIKTLKENSKAKTDELSIVSDGLIGDSNTTKERLSENGEQINHLYELMGELTNHVKKLAAVRAVGLTREAPIDVERASPTKGPSSSKAPTSGGSKAGSSGVVSMPQRLEKRRTAGGKNRASDVNEAIQAEAPGDESDTEPDTDSQPIGAKRKIKKATRWADESEE